MEWMMAIGGCVSCGRVFAFNPNRVPSLRVRRDDQGVPYPAPDGVTEPVCEPCVHRLNALRQQNGLDPWPVWADAYAPVGSDDPRAEM